MRGESPAVPSGSVVLVDTAPVIYLLEDHPLHLPRFLPLFEQAEAGALRILITPITLAEVLVGPLKAGREALAERYEQALTRGLGWTLVPLDAAVSAQAARLRVRYGLKLPDAFQLAAALHHGASALVTHDRDFREAAQELPIRG